MRPIPKAHREIIDSAPFFKQSLLTGRFARPGDRIVIHHAFQYAGRQISELWNYVPLLNSEHDYASPTKSVHNNHELRKYVEFLVLATSDLEAIQRAYPKRDWRADYERGLKQFENFTPF